MSARASKTLRLRSFRSSIPRALRRPGVCHVHGPESVLVADLNAALWLQLSFENF